MSCSHNFEFLRAIQRQMKSRFGGTYRYERDEFFFCRVCLDQKTKEFRQNIYHSYDDAPAWWDPKFATEVKTDSGGSSW